MTRYSEVSRRFYFLNSVVPFEEDTTHEFKGHRNISIEEIPPWCFIPGTDRRSRKAVSRNINGFLNTGKGGTIYLGIVDEGSVKGLHLTLYQKDHVVIAVKDALSRYTPPVQEECYKIEIVPVIRKEEVDNVETALQLQHDRQPTSPSIHRENPANVLLCLANTKQGLLNNILSRGSMDKPEFHFDLDDEETTNRHRPHILRTSEYCWCDRVAMNAFNEGLPAPLYVVEIKVFPWKPKVKTEKGQQCPSLHPVYEDEEGKCYFRRQASLVQYSVQEVVELTKQEVHNYFKPLFSSIKEEMKMIKEHYLLPNNHTEGS